MRRLASMSAGRGVRLAVGLLALGALFGLDAIYVLHFAAEAACAGVDSGDPYDCFICASLFTLGLDLPAEPTVTPPDTSRLLLVPDDVAVAQHLRTHRIGARAPPTLPA